MKKETKKILIQHWATIYQQNCKYSCPIDILDGVYHVLLYLWHVYNNNFLNKTWSTIASFYSIFMVSSRKSILIYEAIQVDALLINMKMGKMRTNNHNVYLLALFSAPICVLLSYCVYIFKIRSTCSYDIFSEQFLQVNSEYHQLVNEYNFWNHYHQRLTTLRDGLAVVIWYERLYGIYF